MRIFIIFVFLNSFPVFAQEKESLILDSEKFLIHFRETKQIGEKVDSLEIRLDFQQDYLIKGASTSDITEIKTEVRWTLGIVLGSFTTFIIIFLGFVWNSLRDDIKEVRADIKKLMERLSGGGIIT